MKTRRKSCLIFIPPQIQPTIWRHDTLKRIYIHSQSTVCEWERMSSIQNIISNRRTLSFILSPPALNQRKSLPTTINMLKLIFYMSSRVGVVEWVSLLNSFAAASAVCTFSSLSPISDITLSSLCSASIQHCCHPQQSILSAFSLSLSRTDCLSPWCVVWAAHNRAETTVAWKWGKSEITENESR